jgi:predicted ester cyclase
VDELCSPSLVEHQFGLAATGEQAREHVRAAIRDVHSAFSDISFTIEDFAEHGDKIWVQVRARGTASGPFFGPPSNKPVDITVFDLARVANGQILEHGGVPDPSPCSRRPGYLTGWRPDTVIATPAYVPRAADPVDRGRYCGRACGPDQPLCAALAPDGEG